jgi:hypothetical protein
MKKQSLSKNYYSLAFLQVASPKITAILLRGQTGVLAQMLASVEYEDVNV